MENTAFKFKPGDRVVFYGNSKNYLHEVPPVKSEGTYLFTMTHESGMFNFSEYGTGVLLYFEDVLPKKSLLTSDQIDTIKEMVNNYGIEHVFLYKTDFDEIEDMEFHQKRREFIQAYSKFEQYLNSLKNESNNQ